MHGTVCRHTSKNQRMLKKLRKTNYIFIHKDKKTGVKL